MSVLESAIGWLAPPQCVSCGLEGSALCLDCSTSEIIAFGGRCWRCGALSESGRTCPGCRRLGGPGFVWINTNYEGMAQDLVRLYKFGQARIAAQPMADLMAQNFLRSHLPGDYLIVPVPTATSRVRQRGFDHSSLLAKLLARKLRLDYYPALRRLGQTRQLGSKRDDRLTQLASSFVVKNPRQILGRDILLIDDVITTGGTLIEATKALRAAGAGRVDALVFAKRL